MKLPRSSPPALHNIVSKLEANGYTLHLEYQPGIEGHVTRPYARSMPFFRGLTMFVIEHAPGEYATGLAFCSVKEPNYCKAKGLKVALGRALRELHKALGREALQTILQD